MKRRAASSKAGILQHPGHGSGVGLGWDLQWPMVRIVRDGAFRMNARVTSEGLSLAVLCDKADKLHTGMSVFGKWMNWLVICIQVVRNKSAYETVHSILIPTRCWPMPSESQAKGVEG